MAWQDLREFLDMLEKQGALHRISVEVDPVLEIAEITARMSTSPGGGSALLFERVKGSRFPVATNVFGSERRVCAGLEVSGLADLTRRVTDLLDQADAPSTGDPGADLSGNPEFARFRPTAVDDGPCREVLEQVADLSAYPFIKSWPGDGGPECQGRALTLPIVFTRDPDTGCTNCGIYRVQLFSPDTVGIGWRQGSGGAGHLEKFRACGERMPVAIVLGGDPATLFSALLPLPESIDEMQFAGFLRGEPVQMVRCPASGIMVPAHAEMVVEGYIDPFETRRGGEYGNHTGFYVPARTVPVMHVSSITRRRDPVFMETVIGPPPMEDCHMAKAAERIMLSFTRRDLPEIVEINLPLEGIFHGAAIVSIDKTLPGQARNVMERIWAGGWLSGSRLLVVVDRDCDVHDLSRSFWKVLNSVEWQRDMVFAGIPGEERPEKNGFPFGGKLGIDATRKLPGEGSIDPWPDEIRMNGSIRELVSSRWHDYGFRD